MIDVWKFVPDLDSARLERLEKFDTFDKVLQRLFLKFEIVAAGGKGQGRRFGVIRASLLRKQKTR